jgi:hypothetical protein
MTEGAVIREATELRSSASFGGVVPSAAVARDASALVAALAVEHHAEGAAVPLLVLSAAPGVLAWEPLDDAVVRDDRDRAYGVTLLHGQAGLGSLQASLWIEPAPPADARVLEVSVPSLSRLAPARGGSGVTRQLSGGPWDLVVDLVPPRTAAPVPARPRSEPGASEGAARVPSRSLGAFVDLVPVGQARIGADVTVCLWAIERYDDLALLTLAMLGPVEGAIPGEAAEFGVWDDRGNAYAAALEHAGSADGWSEMVVRIAPALDPEATRLAVRVVASLPSGDASEFLFGIALPFPT